MRGRKRFNKRNVTDLIFDRISFLMNEYNLPHPSSNGTDEIRKIQLQKDKKHTPEIRIYVCGEMISLYELVDDIHY